MNAKEIYKYDDNDHVIEESTFTPDGILVSKRTYKRDNNGNDIEENTFKSANSLSTKWIRKYVYDSMGNWVKITEIKDGTIADILERKITYY
jgi:hypothetical protein